MARLSRRFFHQQALLDIPCRKTQIMSKHPVALSRNCSWGGGPLEEEEVWMEEMGAEVECMRMLRSSTICHIIMQAKEDTLRHNTHLRTDNASATLHKQPEASRSICRANCQHIPPRYRHTMRPAGSSSTSTNTNSTSTSTRTSTSRSINSSITTSSSISSSNT